MVKDSFGEVLEMDIIGLEWTHYLIKWTQEFEVGFEYDTTWARLLKKRKKGVQ